MYSIPKEIYKMWSLDRPQCLPMEKKKNCVNYYQSLRSVFKGRFHHFSSQTLWHMMVPKSTMCCSRCCRHPSTSPTAKLTKTVMRVCCQREMDRVRFYITNCYNKEVMRKGRGVLSARFNVWRETLTSWTFQLQVFVFFMKLYNCLKTKVVDLIRSTTVYQRRLKHGVVWEEMPVKQLEISGKWGTTWLNQFQVMSKCTELILQHCSVFLWQNSEKS